MEVCHAEVLNSDAQLSTCPFVYGIEGKADVELIVLHPCTSITVWLLYKSGDGYIQADNLTRTKRTPFTFRYQYLQKKNPDVFQYMYECRFKNLPSDQNLIKSCS